MIRNGSKYFILLKEEKLTHFVGEVFEFVTIKVQGKLNARVQA